MKEAKPRIQKRIECSHRERLIEKRGVKGSEDLHFLQKKEEKSEPNFTETHRGDEK
jgi:hypothetical protein